MSKPHYFSLQPSETAIFQAAANIYASYIVAGQVTGENQAEMMKKAIADSISIARHVEKVIQSDDEIAGETNEAGFDKNVQRKR